MRPRDTSSASYAAQIAAYQLLGPAKRVRLAEGLSKDARRLTEAGIRSRHPEYSEEQIRLALIRLLYGDELFVRAWPRSPLLPA